MGIDDFKRSFPTRTVCEVTRIIADEIIYLNKKGLLSDYYYNRIFSLLQEQMRYQKKMDAKLRKYKSDYDACMYKPNPDHEAIAEQRANNK